MPTAPSGMRLTPARLSVGILRATSLLVFILGLATGACGGGGAGADRPAPPTQPEQPQQPSRPRARLDISERPATTDHDSVLTALAGT
ncbi:MAG: hypothetical protein Q8K55_10500, partial [Gemmatimonadaceae bacterium]|nr:hypothetical protein [Gemmatimonadaceae bacterium]